MTTSLANKDNKALMLKPQTLLVTIKVTLILKIYFKAA